MDERLQLQTTSEIVSDERELLILVNEDDVEIGTRNKAHCHDGDGVLHRAFSLFVFNDRDELLIQQRASGKRLWPAFWSNSCCSHPRAGEDIDEAIHRRLEQELGFTTELRFLYKFRYQASFGDAGSEHELCSVYVGHYDGQVNANKYEVDALRWISANDLEREMAESPDQFTPWFKMEWETLTRDYGAQIRLR